MGFPRNHAVGERIILPQRGRLRTHFWGRFLHKIARLSVVSNNHQCFFKKRSSSCKSTLMAIARALLWRKRFRGCFADSKVGPRVSSCSIAWVQPLLHSDGKFSAKLLMPLLQRSFWKMVAEGLGWKLAFQFRVPSRLPNAHFFNRRTYRLTPFVKNPSLGAVGSFSWWCYFLVLVWCIVGGCWLLW